MAIYATASLIISVLSSCFICKQIEATYVISSSDFPSSRLVRSSYASAAESTALEGSKPKLVVCYFASWSTLRQGAAKFLPENIDPNLCSHINYAFASLSDETLTIVPSSQFIDIESRFYAHTVKLKEQNEKLKVLLSLGGWEDSGGDKYSQMVSKPQNRRNFVKQAVSFLNKYKFDGLDLDWEFPVCWKADCASGNPDDRENLVYLTQELRLAFDEVSPSLLLTVALSGSEYIADRAYNIATMTKYVDFLNVMSYNLHGSWENATGHHSEIHEHSNSVSDGHSVSSIMEYYVRKGSPPEKLMMGIPLYGRSFTLTNPNDNGIGAQISGPGRPGVYTKENGLLAYFEICDRIKNDNWKVRRDLKAGPYAFHGDQWVGYDDQISAKEKAFLIMKKGYGGAVFWDISLDDFRGRCHKRTFPIVRELRMNMQPYTTRNKDNGSSTITNMFREILLWIATFVILQEQGNSYEIMY